MGGVASISGLISGLDTDKLIDDLMGIERRSTVLLEARQLRYENLTAAYQSLNATLLILKGNATTLASSRAFLNRTATSSDTDVLSVTASRSAEVGTYQFTVDQLAAAHQVASQGYADSDSTTVGTGSLTITVGDGAAATVELVDGSNTLTALRDAINASDAGVTATIINTGGAAAPYRLVLRADASGADNTITIVNDLTGGTTAEFSQNSVSDVFADDANAYTGTATTSGTYTGNSNKTYVVEIVAGGDEDSATYHVSDDGGQTFGETQVMSGGTVALGDGVQVDFGAGTFADDDRFTIETFVPEVQQAADALITLGQGNGAIQIKTDSNTTTGVIPGVTLNLLSTTSGTPVTVAVAADTETTVSNIPSFVQSYNSVVEYIKEQSYYDEENNIAGVLIGDTTVQRMQLTLSNAMISAVTGLSSTLNGLHSIGIMPGDSGQLTIDTSELNEALAGDPEGVMRIFARAGQSDDSLIQYTHASSDTVIPAGGFYVTVTQAASKGKAVGSTIGDPAASSIVIDSSNKYLYVKVNGQDSNLITLTEGTYTSGASLATEIQTRINGDDNLLGHGVTVEWVDEGATGHFEIYSTLYGSSSSVAMADSPGNAAATLGLDSVTSTAGTDVEGTINGETAVGSGQRLEGLNGGRAAGLTLTVTATPVQIAAAGGSLNAKVTVTTGVAAQINYQLDSLTDPTDGLFQRSVENFQSRIDSFQTEIQRQEDILERRRLALINEFTQLELALAQMQNQSSFLADLASTSWYTRYNN